MFASAKYSYLFLRLGLAAVFLWFGIDKFIHPNYWINAWLPQWFGQFLSGIGVSTMTFIYFQGVFETAIGLSFILNLFIKLFSFLAAIFLILVLLAIGLNEIIVRDLGLLGGVLSLLFWPQRSRF